MSDHVIVWDLETVPDIAGYAAAKGLDGKCDDEVPAAMGDKFPKHIYRSIVSTSDESERMIIHRVIDLPAGPARAVMMGSRANDRV